MTADRRFSLQALDRARWTAAVAVVLVHCAAYPLQSTTEFGSTAWYWSNFYDAAARWCVPVFVMISGALLLEPGRVSGIAAFYQRRAARILPALVFWSLFYLCWSAFMHAWQQEPLTMDAWLGKLLKGAPYYHLWYLYMIVGLYLFAPFLQRMYQACSPHARLLALATILACAAADAAHHHLAADGRPGFFFNAFLPYIGYFLAGRLIYERTLSLPWPGGLFAASVAASTLGVALMSQPVSLDFYFYDAFNPAVILMSLAAFQWLLQARTVPRLGALAPLTFGVYLLHPVFLDLAKTLGLYAPGRHSAWQIPLATAGIFGLSMAAIWLLRRIPVARQVT